MQNPGRVDYARDRVPVAVVDACRPAGDRWCATVTCRNKAAAGSLACVLSPRRPVREARLSCDLVRNGGQYALDLPWPVEPLDMVCLRTDTYTNP